MFGVSLSKATYSRILKSLVDPGLAAASLKASEARELEKLGRLAREARKEAASSKQPSSNATMSSQLIDPTTMIVIMRD